MTTKPTLTPPNFNLNQYKGIPSYSGQVTSYVTASFAYGTETQPCSEDIYFNLDVLSARYGLYNADSRNLDLDIAVDLSRRLFPTQLNSIVPAREPLRSLTIKLWDSGRPDLVLHIFNDSTTTKPQDRSLLATLAIYLAAWTSILDREKPSGTVIGYAQKQLSAWYTQEEPPGAEAESSGLAVQAEALAELKRKASYLRILQGGAFYGTNPDSYESLTPLAAYLLRDVSYISADVNQLIWVDHLKAKYGDASVDVRRRW